jgi:hypothetical protein
MADRAGERDTGVAPCSCLSRYNNGCRSSMFRLGEWFLSTGVCCFLFFRLLGDPQRQASIRHRLRWMRSLFFSCLLDHLEPHVLHDPGSTRKQRYHDIAHRGRPNLPAHLYPHDLAMVRPVSFTMVGQAEHLLSLTFSLRYVDDCHFCAPPLSFWSFPSLFTHRTVTHCCHVGAMVDMKVAAIALRGQVPCGRQPGPQLGVP